MPVIENPKPTRHSPNAEHRIKQLLSKNSQLREQVAYMQWVASRMIPLLPKATVTHILDAAKKFSQPTKEKHRAS
jgi:hypothetical protein